MGHRPIEVVKNVSALMIVELLIKQQKRMPRSTVVEPMNLCRLTFFVLRPTVQSPFEQFCAQDPDPNATVPGVRCESHERLQVP